MHLEQVEIKLHRTHAGKGDGAMEEIRPILKEFASTVSTGPTYTRYKCCTDGGGCTEFDSWTQVGPCYEYGGHLQRRNLKDK